MAGVWAARADNTAVHELYVPDSGDEIIVGWTGPSTFVVMSFYARCAEGQLRAYDIATQHVTPMFWAFLNSAALDPATGTALVAVDEIVAACNDPAGPGGQPGLYLARANDVPQRIWEEPASLAAWVPGAGLFVALTGARDGGLQTLRGFSPAGDEVALPAGLTDYPAVTPDGRAWAWTGPDRIGLWAAIDGEAPRLIYADRAVQPLWSPDGATLFFFADDTLYAAAAPALAPAPVQPPGLLAALQHVSWVLP
jgi:hypothetical protein